MQSRLFRRLFPFYAAVLLQGCVLWYPVEKLFMRRIGFDDAGIGIMVAFYSAIMLLVETPSGILADRWSRKGVLIVGSLLLAASSFVGGISHGVAMYMLCAAFWGLFFALYSGLYDSILYDTLVEELGDAKQYQRYYGYVKVWDSVALVVGSLAGGLISSHWGIRQAYFWNIPVVALSIVALALFKEPVLHKAHAHASARQQIKETFQAVLRKGQLRYVLAVLVVMSAVSYTLYEFDQLWWIALAFPVVMFGPANAILLATIGLGGVTASTFRLHRRLPMQLAIAVMILACVGLVFLHNGVLSVACQVVIGVGTIALCVVFTKFLHDSLPSRVRAGAASAVGSLTRIVMIPLSLLFGFISRESTVFRASWLFAALLLASLILAGRLFGGRHELEAAAAEDESAGVQYQK